MFGCASFHQHEPEPKKRESPTKQQLPERQAEKPEKVTLKSAQILEG